MIGGKADVNGRPVAAYQGTVAGDSTFHVHCLFLAQVRPVGRRGGVRWVRTHPQISKM